ncbi:MAG: tetratricopeptide repeat protein [Aquisalimonadaceae bacterium]
MRSWLHGELRRPARACGVVLLALAVSGCASRGALFDRVDAELQQGRTEQALTALEPLAASGRNQALYLLNRGMLLRMAGDIDGSIAAFEQAKTAIGQLQPISISESLATWAIAEDSGSYKPPVHEHLLLHAYQALNFLQAGRLEEARVEALQIDLGLRRVDPANHRAPHGGDAFPRYISGLIFEANEDWSDALIAYRKAYESYTQYRQPIPRDLQYSLLRLTDYLELIEERNSYAETFGIQEWAALDTRPDRATVVLVVHDGFAPRLREESVVIGHPSENRLIRVSLPALEARPTRLSRIRLVADGVQTDGDAVEDVSAAADAWLSAQIPGLLARAVTRNVARNEMTRRVERDNQGLALLVNLVGTFLENADTRTWRTLPDRLHLARMQVPPGRHVLRMELLDNAGRVVGGSEQNLDLHRGTTTVLTAHWFGNSLW